MDHRRVDNYELLDELGYGGMATVWRARDTRLDREVAVKILHDHIASRPENRDRFEREAKAMARLRHPNIPDVYGFSSPNAPVQYIAVERIDGPTLRELVEQDVEANGGRVGAPEIGAALGLIVAKALAHAHESGVIHRDIKPENVMLTADGRPQLMDFGLARVMDANKLTQTGAILGSPAHMSPEVIEGGDVDHRADIFAFGTLLYYICTGQLPFDGRNPAVILNAILSGDYTPADRVDARVPRALSALIDDCLRTAPGDRPESMATVTERLESVAHEAGLDDPDGALERWFAAPAPWVAGFRERRLGELERDAAEALRRGRVAAAMRIADRILAWSPGHEGALTLLDRARVRHRVRGLAWGGVAVILLVAMATLIVLRYAGETDAPVVDVPDPDTSAADTRLAGLDGADVNEPDVGDPDAEGPDDAGPPPEAVARAEADGAAAAEAVTRAAAAVAQRVVDTPPNVGLDRDAVNNNNRVIVDPARLNVDVRRPDAGATVDEGANGADGGDTADVGIGDPDAGTVATVAPIAVQFRIQPGTAFVHIDGEAPRAADGRYLEQAADVNRNLVPLAPGRYTLRAWLPDQSEFAVERRIDVSADADGFELTVPFGPARLTVDSPVEGSVLVARDGGAFTQMGRAGQPIDLVMGAEATTEIRVNVVPDAGGEVLQSDAVTIQSGQNLTLRVDR